MTDILIDRQNGVLKIGINRPHKKNALTANMYNEIRCAIESAETNSDVNVVFLYGTNEAFTAGNDLKDFDNRDFDGPSPAANLLYVMHKFNKPIVAAVSGVSIGIGATLLLHCDFIYAAPTRFRMPFVNLGVCPEAGSSLLLPRLAGHRKAAEILMFGDFFDTNTAITLGLVNTEVPVENLLTFAINKAEALAQKPTQAIQTTKQLMKRTDQALIVDQMNEEFKHFARLLQSSESQEIRANILTKKRAN